MNKMFFAGAIASASIFAAAQAVVPSEGADAENPATPSTPPAPTTYVWSCIHTDGRFLSGKWADAVNWTLADGSAAEKYPGAGDVVQLPTGMNANSVREISLALTQDDTIIGTVKGDACFNIALTSARNDSHQTIKRTVKIENPNNFAGMWRPAESRIEFLFENDASFTPRLAGLATQTRAYVNVTNADARVKIGLLQAKDDAKAFDSHGQTIYRGGGALTKLGPGTLEIEEAAGIEERIYVKQGTLSLNGRARPDADMTLEKILSRAYLRLDASRRDTMQTYEGEDGRLYVTNWFDVNGSGRSAHRDVIGNAPTYSQDFVKTMSDPFINAKASSSGLDLMDFGSASLENVEKLGPRHGILRFAECNQVRELFVVRARTDDTATYNSMLGHSTEYPLHTSGVYGLFDRNAHVGVREGEIRLNGIRAFYGAHMPYDPYAQDGSRLHVLNVAATEALKFNLLGSDRYFHARTGGCRIGEVLLFNEVLTAAERALVNDYLMAKWFKGSVPCDVGAVVLKPNTTLDVPAGRIAHIHRLSVTSNTLVKTGGGTLVVDFLSPADVKIAALGGNVHINPRGLVPATAAPASAPFVWLDATAQDTMSFSNAVEEAGAVSYLTNWADKAGGPVYAEPAFGSWLFNTNFPVVKKDIPLPGLAVVDFGNTGSIEKGKDSWMWLSKRGDIAREGFIVLRFRRNLWGNIFGSSSQGFMRNAHAVTARMIQESYAATCTAASQWTHEGAVEDPFESRYSYTYGDNAPFYVVSFAAPEKVAADLLAKDRLDERGQGVGSVQIGEMILYDRILTAQERYDTEAYLINRWKAATYPVPEVAYNFGDDEPRVFETTGDLTVKTVSGGTASYVKKGPGKLTLQSSCAQHGAQDAPPSFAVHGGELAVSYAHPVPLFRFDASADTFEGTYTADGVTYATKWRDAGGRDLCATNIMTTLTQTNTALVTYETRSGVFRRVADFGASSADRRAGMRMTKRFANVREAMSVHCDRESQNFFCSRETHHYLRGWNVYRQLFQPYSAGNVSFVYEGYMAVDGEEKPYTYVFPGGFHIIDCAPTNVTQIDNLALDRRVTGGGAYIAEQFAFAEKLSAARRAAIVAALKYKWFGEGQACVMTNDIASIMLGGGTLTIEPDGVQDEFFDQTCFRVDVLAGEGVFAAPYPVFVNSLYPTGPLCVEGDLALAGESTLSVAFDAQGQIPALTVTGTFRAADDVTVSLGAENPSAIRAGKYTLVSSQNLDGVHSAKWHLDRTFLPRKWTGVLRTADRDVLLHILPSGTVLLMR